MIKSKNIRKFYEKYPFPNELKPENHYYWIFTGLDFNEVVDKKIIDVGCGTGDIASILAKHGKVTGLDFCHKSIKIAKRNYPHIRFILDDLTKSKHSEKYDYVFCIGVLHHIPEVDKAIENIKRLMKPETKLIILVYNKYAYLKRNIFKNKNLKNNISMWKDMYEHPYMHGYSKREFINLMKKHGINNIKQKSRNIPEILRLLTGRGESMIFHCKLK